MDFDFRQSASRFRSWREGGGGGVKDVLHNNYRQKSDVSSFIFYWKISFEIQNIIMIVKNT